MQKNICNVSKKSSSHSMQKAVQNALKKAIIACLLFTVTTTLTSADALIAQTTQSVVQLAQTDPLFHCSLLYVSNYHSFSDELIEYTDHDKEVQEDETPQSIFAFYELLTTLWKELPAQTESEKGKVVMAIVENALEQLRRAAQRSSTPMLSSRGTSPYCKSPVTDDCVSTFFANRAIALVKQ